MFKYKLSITEILKYEREMIIETEEELELGTLNLVCNRAERHCDYADDVATYLENVVDGIKIIEDVDNDLDSPSESELEIDWEDIDE